MTDKTPATQDPGREGMGRLIAGAVLVVLVLLFAIFNRSRVEVDYVVFDRNSRLIYVIIVSALLGAVADRLIQRRRRS